MRKREILDKSLSMGLMMMLFLFLTKSGDAKSLSLITVSLTYMGGVFLLLLIFLPRGAVIQKAEYNGDVEELSYVLYRFGFELEQKIGGTYIFVARKFLILKPRRIFANFDTTICELYGEYPKELDRLLVTKKSENK